MIDTIHLGYEVGTGNPVAIPLKHMAVTGQTQESGKTTTLEALVSRLEPGTAALTFITKRGESAFQGGDALGVRWERQPYFRDRADWQFVDGLLAAQLQEKNKFLRPWIMRICRTTRTLAEVHAKVKEALRTAKGIHEGVYTQLDAYLELIVPEIRRARLSDSLRIDPGLNVMDVSGFATPMQMLFAQSALDYVNAVCAGTVVVVPEAWEFIPEGKGSPVKSSAVSLVRKGAAISNYIWVDSQDMAGVDKVILRGCHVWLIGVQREANELKRNLSNIPAGIAKPSAKDVALLERGQFYACWGKHAIKTYVQPAWMDNESAQMIARGTMDREARMLEHEIQRSTPKGEPVVFVKNRREAFNEALWSGAAVPVGPVSLADFYREEGGVVTEKEARALIVDNDRLRGEVKELRQKLDDVLKRQAIALPSDLARVSKSVERPNPVAVSLNGDEDALYQRFRDRLAKEDPKILVLAMSETEIEVQVERQVIEAKHDTLFGRLAGMIAEGYFNEPGTGNSAYSELQGRRGFRTAKPNVYRELDKLAHMGFLTKEEGGYQAVKRMKVNIVNVNV